MISFGATARGAVTALFALGVHDVTVLTHRSVSAVAAPIAPARLVHYDRDPARPGRTLALNRPESESVAEFLAEHDIVVNCILQDTDEPLTFVMDDELELFPPGSLLIDVSCDEGMGFEWARPTSFADPIFTVGAGVRYYAVDHSPSYLWDSATWEISEALIPFLGHRHVRARRPGTTTRRSAARSRSAPASCRTRGSCPSSPARRRIPTPSGDRGRAADGATCACAWATSAPAPRTPPSRPRTGRR